MSLTGLTQSSSPRFSYYSSPNLIHFHHDNLPYSTSPNLIAFQHDILPYYASPNLIDFHQDILPYYTSLNLIDVHHDNFHTLHHQIWSFFTRTFCLTICITKFDRISSWHIYFITILTKFNQFLHFALLLQLDNLLYCTSPNVHDFHIWTYYTSPNLIDFHHDIFPSHP